MAEINWTDEAERWLKDIHNSYTLNQYLDSRFRGNDRKERACLREAAPCFAKALREGEPAKTSWPR